jgi:hypothetical protein
MSALGQKQTYAPQKVMSALPPKADIRGAKCPLRAKSGLMSIQPYQADNLRIRLGRGLT